MPSKSILIVEDETKLARLLQEYVEQAGFPAAVLSRGDEVLPRVKKHDPDMILLDLMLPGMNGMDVCREIRKFSTVPIIMITARVEEIDRLIGLELGADDYICKPFSPREVVARIKAIFRRMQPAPTGGSKLTAGPVELDPEIRQVSINGTPIPLTPNEFKLLQILMTTPNKVFERDELIQRVQGYEFDGYDRTIDSHIKNLRKKIAGQLPGREVIITVYGIGYKLNEP